MLITQIWSLITRECLNLCLNLIFLVKLHLQEEALLISSSKLLVYINSLLRHNFTLKPLLSAISSKSHTFRTILFQFIYSKDRLMLTQELKSESTLQKKTSKKTGEILWLRATWTAILTKTASLIRVHSCKEAAKSDVQDSLFSGKSITRSDVIFFYKLNSFTTWFPLSWSLLDHLAIDKYVIVIVFLLQRRFTFNFDVIIYL